MKPEKEVLKLLSKRGLTLAAAESCTGGLIAKRLTDIPGASKVFLGGIVTYSVSAKVNALGVDGGIIAKYGVVSPVTASFMAYRAAELFDTDIGIGVTGVAGPGPDDEGNEEGTVFAALSDRNGETLIYQADMLLGRKKIRENAAELAFDLIKEYIEQTG